MFGSYEDNRQDRDNRVFLGSTPFPPSLDFLRDQEGTFVSPFREHLFFGKVNVAAARRSSARRELQRPHRDRHPQFRRPDQLRLG